MAAKIESILAKIEKTFGNLPDSKPIQCNILYDASCDERGDATIIVTTKSGKTKEIDGSYRFEDADSNVEYIWFLPKSSYYVIDLLTLWNNNETKKNIIPDEYGDDNLTTIDNRCFELYDEEGNEIEDFDDFSEEECLETKGTIRGGPFEIKLFFDDKKEIEWRRDRYNDDDKVVMKIGKSKLNMKKEELLTLMIYLLKSKKLKKKSIDKKKTRPS